MTVPKTIQKTDKTTHFRFLRHAWQGQLTPVLNDEQLSHRINSSTVRLIRFVVSATYKTETNRRRVARLAWTNNSSKTDLIESPF